MFSRLSTAFTVLVFVAGAGVSAAAESARDPVTVILGAQTREIAMLREELEDREEHDILGLRYWEGRLVGRRAVVARMASGKVNAAMFATLAIEHFKPAEIIVTGIAGGLNPELGPGDIVIARRVVHHDTGRIHPGAFEYRGSRNPIRGGRHPVFMEPPTYLLDIAQRAVKQTELIPIAYKDRVSTAPHKVRVIAGTVATGDTFVASDDKRDELRDHLKADAVEMEGAAVHQVCKSLDVPCIVIRSMSDMADNSAITDLQTFADVAAANSAHLVREILRLLKEREKNANAK
jgi:adenosylhomocysteine nucleosidase